jgi:hypothetical protein
MHSASFQRTVFFGLTANTGKLYALRTQRQPAFGRQVRFESPKRPENAENTEYTVQGKNISAKPSSYHDRLALRLFATMKREQEE